MAVYADEPGLSSGLGFKLSDDGIKWDVKEIPQDVIDSAEFSGYLTIEGYNCSVFETADKQMWAQKSVNTGTDDFGKTASLLTIAIKIINTR